MDLVRVDFALIPASPLFEAVIAASQAITDEFYYNENIIDATTFPPHLSLHICAVPQASLGDVAKALATAAAAGLPDIVPVAVEPSRGGYVMLSVERTPELMALHEAALAAAAQARDGLGDDQHDGRYVRDSFAPHLSLAKLGRDDQAEATEIARRALGEASRTLAQALQLCDIGERSERWDILASFPATAPQ